MDPLPQHLQTRVDSHEAGFVISRALASTGCCAVILERMATAFPGIEIERMT